MRSSSTEARPEWRLLPPGHVDRNPARQGGIALMLVLWVVALLTIIAVAMTGAQRTESTLAANQIDAARFRAQATAAINYSAIQLMLPPPVDAEDTTDAWVPDGQTRRWTFAGETLEIRIQNEASLIDLNKASRELLSGLLSAVEIPEADRDPLLDAILDWRDENDLHLPNGAEDPDYRSAGLPYGAKDAPFDSVEELRQVLGFDRDLYAAISPALTVASGSSRIVEDLAPPLVLAAQRGVTLEEIEADLLEESVAEMTNTGSGLINRGGPLYRIRVARTDASAAMLTMEALVSIQSAATSPVRVLWRRYGLTAQSSGEQSIQGQEEGE